MLKESHVNIIQMLPLTMHWTLVPRQMNDIMTTLTFHYEDFGYVGAPFLNRIKEVLENLGTLLALTE